LERFGKKPLVSIIIPTYNSEKTIEKCLQSVKNQSYKEIETIVVDRHSNDKTIRIAEHFQARLLFVTQERSTSKNYAARRARGNFLFFIDSDMTMAPTTVEESVAYCDVAGSDAIVVPLKSVSEGRLGECRKIERQSLSTLGELMDAPRFFRKAAFLKAGGFDEKIVIGEDYDLTKRFRKMEYKIGAIRSELTHYEGNPSMFAVLSKAYYYGKTLPSLVKKEPRETATRYASIRIESLRVAGSAFRSMASLSSYAVMKAFEYVAYATGFLVQLVRDSLRSSQLRACKKRLLTNKLALANFAILLLVSAVVFRNFFLSEEWPGGGDVMGFISRAYLYGKDFRWLYTWRSYSFGFVEGANSMDLFFMLLYSILKSPSWTVKFFIFLSYLTAAFSMYFFVYRHTRKHVAALAASLVYVLNPWLFSQLTEAHADIVFSYALAPLVFVLLDNALRTGRSRDILFLSLGMCLFVTGFHPESVVIYGVFLVFFVLFFLFSPSEKQRFWDRFRRVLKVSIPSTLLVLSLSAFFFVPFLANVRAPYFHSSYTYPLEDSYASSYTVVEDAFTLRAVERWGYVKVVDVYSGLGLPDFPVETFLIIIFALAYCVLLIRRDRYTFFFAFSTLVSVFLAKGPYPPFGQFFVWAWTNVPHFAVFRAASRWIMMAAFSHAFFISLLVYYLMEYVEGKTSLHKIAQYFKVDVKEVGRSRSRKVAVSIDFFNVLLKRLQRFVYVASIGLLIFIFLSGFLSCFFFFSHGLQVHSPSVQELAPYEWLASQQNDNKVVSVCRSPSEWVNPSGGESDFGFGGMLTPLGWSHDVGFDGSFIHDKPILQNGGWGSKSRQFVDYLRFRLVRERLSDRLLKILGAFGYEYVVIPSYITNQTRSFFLNQKGYQVAYNLSGTVLQNEYAAPRMFVVNQSMFVVGGFDSMDALCKIESYDPRRTALEYAPESTDDETLSKMINSSQMVCFADTTIADLAMTSLGQDATLMFAADYGFSSLNLTKYWVKWTSWRTTGAFVLGGDILTTVGKNTIDIPFESKSDGQYSIFLRIGFAPTRGVLSLYVDGKPIGELHPYYPVMSKLQWVNMTTTYLAKGHHFITIENDGTGYNDIDAIAVARPSDVAAQVSKIANYLQGSQARLLYLLEAEHTFLNSTGNDWYWSVRPYDGYIIRSDNMGLNVATSAKANATSETELMEANRAIDGSMSTRWTSQKTVLPQWLQLTWNSTQNLQGAQISFENAYATDYAVQTWNGTTWLNQTIISGNTDLVKLCTFNQSVATDRLRIYVTGFSGFDRVSIWELQAYSTNITFASSKLSIPRKGSYMLGARVATGPNKGTLYFKINERTYSVSCISPENQFEWREFGPFNLTTDEATIAIGTVGIAELDELLLYSLKNNESYLSLNDLFSSPTPQVSTTYEKVNPCTYRVHINATGPFSLIFSETYDPLWKATAGEVTFSPTPAYSLVNSFRIDKSGQYTLIIYYTGQSYTDMGLLIFSVTFVSSLIMLPLLTSSRVTKRRFTQQNMIT